MSWFLQTVFCKLISHSFRHYTRILIVDIRKTINLSKIPEEFIPGEMLALLDGLTESFAEFEPEPSVDQRAYAENEEIEASDTRIDSAFDSLKSGLQDELSTDFESIIRLSESMDTLPPEGVPTRDILNRLDIPSPPYGVAHSVEEAVATADDLGYPTLIRPSYVLGGEGMRIAINRDEVAEYVDNILSIYPDNEILLDRFLEDATEIDVDAVCDGEEVWITGIMEHIEPAGVHSGDSTAVLPPFSLSEEIQETIRQYTRELAFELDVTGLLNVQMIVKDGTVYVIEANPRASRTVPFVAKASGIPIPAIATKVMLGESLSTFREQGLLESDLEGYAIKEPVFSWDKFPEVPKELGPEMKSTGESIAFVDSLSVEEFEQPHEMKDLYLSR